MMVLSILLAVVCACVSMVTVEGLPSQKYYLLATNDRPAAFNSNPYNEKVIQTYQDDDSDEVMQIQEYDHHLRPSQSRYSGFQEKSDVTGIAYVSSFYGDQPTYKRIKSTSSPPYSAIAYLVTTKYICTGTFIRPKVILTAAHCLYEIVEEKEVSYEVTTIRRRKECDKQCKGEPFTQLDSTYVSDKYKTKDAGHLDYDYGLIFTNEESSEVMNVKIVDVKDLAADKQIRIAGYPKNSNKKDCMMESSGTVVGPEPIHGVVFYHNCDTDHGMSGGPVYDENNDIIGINIRGFSSLDPPAERFNTALPMSASVVAKIEAIIKEKFDKN